MSVASESIVKRNVDSWIGKKFLLKRANDPNDQPLCDHASEVIFEGELVGPGGRCTVVGLLNRGELVLNKSWGLRLFLWVTDDGFVMHDFKEICEEESYE